MLQYLGVASSQRNVYVDGVVTKTCLSGATSSMTFLYVVVIPDINIAFNCLFTLGILCRTLSSGPYSVHKCTMTKSFLVRQEILSYLRCSSTSDNGKVLCSVFTQKIGTNNSQLLYGKNKLVSVVGRAHYSKIKKV